MRLPDRAALERFGRRAKWRWRWTLLAFGLGAGSTWMFKKDIFQWLLVPAEGRLSPFEGGPPVFTAPADLFGASFNLAIKGGIAAALPVLLIGTYTLISPALPNKPRRFLSIFAPATVIFFAGGVAFVYYVMLPVSLRFLLNFGDGIAVPLISLKQYLELLTALMFWIGVVFELPLIMYLMARTEVVSYKRLKASRRIVPAFAGVLAAVITPTFDAANWLMVMIPIILLYEVGLFLAWMAHPEDGNYLFFRSIYNWIRWVLRRPKVFYRNTIGRLPFLP